MERYEFYPRKIAAGDRQLRQHLESFGSKLDPLRQPLGPKPKGKKGSKHAPEFELRSEL